MAVDQLVNPVKERMQAGGVSLGMPVRLGRSGDIARIDKATGHDFIFIDCQHSLFNLETIGHIASTALAIGIAPLVRVRGIDDPDVSLLLDNGAMGIVYPDVNTATQARKAVDGFMTAAQKAVTTMESHADNTKTGVKDVGQTAMGFAEQNITNSFEFAQRLVRAKDVQEVMALQQEYLQSQMKAMSEQAKDLGTHATKMAMDSAKPKT